MKRRNKALSITSLAAVLAGWLVWQFGPFQAVQAVASLSDPDKLATLGERAANPRLNKIVYWLNEGEERFLSAEVTINVAQWLNGTREPRASLVRESLLRNLKIARNLGLLTSENQELLRHGKAGVVTKGPAAGSKIEIDHIVPFSLAPEVGNELANLEMMPEKLNRSKSNRVGERQMAHAAKLRAAGLLTEKSYARLQERARPTSRSEIEEARD